MTFIYIICSPLTQPKGKMSLDSAPLMLTLWSLGLQRIVSSRSAFAVNLIFFFVASRAFSVWTAVEGKLFNDASQICGAIEAAGNNGLALLAQIYLFVRNPDDHSGILRYHLSAYFIFYL